MNSSPSPYLDLTTVIRCVRAAVGGWGGRGLLSAALTLLLFRRLGGICVEFERLVARFQAGRLRQVATRAAAGESVGGSSERRASPDLLWPRRFGWLVLAARHLAAVYGGQLRVILEQPEMVELLIAAPQARRILRPVCRMLAVEARLLRPRPAGAAAETASADVCVVVKARVRKPRVPIDWGRIPLPRGVLSAARRRGIRKGG